MRTTTIPVRFTVLALLAGLSAPAGAQDRAGEPAQEGAPKDWQGRYRYEHVAGRTAGGTGIVVNYDLVMLPPDVRNGCVLTVRGFQSDEALRCRTRRDGQDLVVAFDRYGDGGTVNKYGVAVYKPGQPLFTLAKVARAKDAALTTRWQGLMPDGQGVAESGATFKKMR
ncbi:MULTISPECIES: DUF5991 domain-containing protein [Methylorubrum]|uniref:DUF5991 domain-containing protein n=1 Tax=Methylorubrum TaxID=2282523 RepID=UPI00209F48BE|nr:MULTISPECIES: DUF5991 domain-containing protein [Methylorubrum]MCP1547806.1 hypothetical protein [Methylorubrum zatmanii]MCP1555578.1 hypothetical protein [Methylorubrum extorquens]MCP1578109.1 hypothetical protein [Methylorubrum extorquens]